MRIYQLAGNSVHLEGFWSQHESRPVEAIFLTSNSLVNGARMPNLM